MGSASLRCSGIIPRCLGSTCCFVDFATFGTFTCRKGVLKGNRSRSPHTHTYTTFSSLLTNENHLDLCVRSLDFSWKFVPVARKSAFIRFNFAARFHLRVFTEKINSQKPRTQTSRRLRFERVRTRANLFRSLASVKRGGEVSVQKTLQLGALLDRVQSRALCGVLMNDNSLRRRPEV